MPNICSGCGLVAPPAPTYRTTLARDSADQFFKPVELKAELRRLYKPLRGGQTRLIKLNAPYDGRLTADLIVADIRRPEGADPPPIHLEEASGSASNGRSQKVPFEALSYVCGSQPLDDVIECNGVKIPITRHLSTILHCIQHSFSRKTPYLWVDAICINRFDPHEKACQVIRLLEIFAKADSVIAWLGEADLDGLLAFSFIGTLLYARYDIPQAKHGQSQDEASKAQVNALHGTLTRLCERPWFKRLWIRSEIFGAKDITLMIGSFRTQSRKCIYQSTDRTSFLRLEAIFKKISTCSLHPDLPTAEPLSALSALRRPAILSPQNFSTTLISTRNLGVSLPQDRIYSVLGICAVPARDSLPYDSTPSSSSDLFLTVDYSKPSPEVSLEATLYILSKRADVSDLPNLFNFHERPQIPSNNPRWVPDFNPSPALQLLPHTSDLTPFIPLPISPVAAAARDYPFPTISRSPAALHLSLRVRATNYIAHLTPWTLPPASFATLARSPATFGYALSPAGRGIHSSFRAAAAPPSGAGGGGKGEDGVASEGFFSRKPLFPERFERGKHSRRIALLGIGAGGEGEGIALVPCDAEEGDLVVVVEGEGVLPIVITPRRKAEVDGEGQGGGAGVEERKDAGFIPAKAKNAGRRRRRLIAPRRGRTLLREKLPRLPSFGTALWFVVRVVFVSLAIEAFFAMYLQLASYGKHWPPGAKAFCFALPVLLAVLLIWYDKWNDARKRARGVLPARAPARWRASGGDGDLARLGTAIAKRRGEVTKLLDRVTERVGEEWEFVGPVLVRHAVGAAEVVRRRPLKEIRLY